jgi:hypothetical protein
VIDGGHEIGGDAVALRVIFDAVEHYRRSSLGASLMISVKVESSRSQWTFSTVMSCPILFTSLSHVRRSRINIFFLPSFVCAAGVMINIRSNCLIFSIASIVLNAAHRSTDSRCYGLLFGSSWACQRMERLEGLELLASARAL